MSVYIEFANTLDFMLTLDGDWPTTNLELKNVIREKIEYNLWIGYGVFKDSMWWWILDRYAGLDFWGIMN